jgi:hypothetical protein
MMDTAGDLLRGMKPRLGHLSFGTTCGRFTRQSAESRLHAADSFDL